MYILSESQIKTDSAQHTDKEEHLAPAGRYIYSTPINKYPKAPEGRQVYPKNESTN